MNKIFAMYAMLLTVQQTSAQHFEWAFGLGGVGNNQYANIETDSEGNLYFGATFYESFDIDPGLPVKSMTTAGSYDFCLAKYTPDKSLIWAFKMGGVKWDQLNDIAIDAEGNVFVTGSFLDQVDFDPGPGESNLTAVGEEDGFIAKYNKDGQFQWVKRLTGFGYCFPQQVKIDAAGHIVVVGLLKGVVDMNPANSTYNLVGDGIGNDQFVLKLNAAGLFQWVKKFETVDQFYNNYISGLAVDEDNNIYLSGMFLGTYDMDLGNGEYLLSGSSNYQSIFFQKMTPAGELLWVKKIGGDAGSCSAFTPGLHIYNGGEIYLTGFQSAPGTIDMDPGAGEVYLPTPEMYNFLGKYDNNGNLIWVGGIEGSCILNKTAIDKTGGLYITGKLGIGDYDFSPGASSHILHSNKEHDLFAARYKPDGSLDWAFNLQQNTYTGGEDITVDKDGNVYTSGYFFTTADFNPGTETNYLTSNGNSDFFVLKMSPAGVPTHQVPATTQLAVYPNPTQEYFLLSAPQDLDYQVLDIMGRTVAKGITTASPVHINLSHCKPGVYGVWVGGRTVKVVVQR